jgi:Phosphodiester glycosidase
MATSGRPAGVQVSDRTDQTPPEPSGGWWQRWRARPMTKARRIRRRALGGLLALVLLAGGWFAWSFSGYVRDSQGEPTSVLLAEWGRDHGLGGVVVWAENFYYAHLSTTPVGGTPTTPVTVGGGAVVAAGRGSTHPHLQPPPPIVSPAAHPLPGEGGWQPVGSLVDGLPAVYVARVRPDAVHTSVLVSLMWIDTDLTRAMLVPGYIEPGGPAPSQGALPQVYWPSVLANFNGGFRHADSRGGYFYHGDTVSPLVRGRASAVIMNDGTLRVGAWGRDVSMTPQVSVVLQNLDLIIDNGRSMVAPGDNFQWGATTHGESYAWRSALGQRADGSLVYIGSPGLSAQTMAQTLLRAGVVRAMVLDMNNWWVAGFYFTHTASGAPVCAKLDPNIQEGCNRFLERYKRDSFQILARP